MGLLLSSGRELSITSLAKLRLALAERAMIWYAFASSGNLAKGPWSGEIKMGKHGIFKFVCTAVILGILPLTGCIVYHGDVSYGEKGKPLTERTLRRVECGTTSKDWLTTTLGEPSQQKTTSDGTEILEYRYSVKKDNHFVMPFVIVNDKNETTQTVFFEISDGVVKNYWKETSKHSDR
jgi:hypothetical protein